MCSNCEEILIGFSIPHPVIDCPLLKSRYCSYCCEYGHLSRDCSDKDAESSRSKPSVALSPRTPKIPAAVLEIEKSDKMIRQVLMNYSIQPSGKMKQNKKLLEEVANELGRKLEYIDPH